MGLSAYGLRENELAAQRFTYQLVSEHIVDGDIYTAAHEAFGDPGLVEMLVLIGCYLSVCALLSAFAVPVPDARPVKHGEDAQ